MNKLINEANFALGEQQVKEEMSENEITKDVIRYIPTGSKVVTQLLPEVNPKTMKINIIEVRSAPPLVTTDISNIERSILHNVDLLLKDIGTKIDIKHIDKERHVHMEGKEGKIYFSFSFSISVANVTEGKKLVELDNILDFYKK